jgi:hypothetical protein
MADETLKDLGDEVIGEILPLWADLRDLRERVANARARVAAAEATVQALRDGGPGAAAVRADLDALLQVSDRLAEGRSQVEQLLGFEISLVSPVVERVRIGLQNPSALLPIDVQELLAVVNGFRRLELLQNSASSRLEFSIHLLGRCLFSAYDQRVGGGDQVL